MKYKTYQNELLEGAADPQNSKLRAMQAAASDTDIGTIEDLESKRKDSKLTPIVKRLMQTFKRFDKLAEKAGASSSSSVISTIDNLKKSKEWTSEMEALWKKLEKLFKNIHDTAGKLLDKG